MSVAEKSGWKKWIKKSLFSDNNFPLKKTTFFREKWKAHDSRQWPLKKNNLKRRPVKQILAIVYQIAKDVQYFIKSNIWLEK